MADAPWMNLYAVKSAVNALAADPNNVLWKYESFTSATWLAILNSYFPISDTSATTGAYLIAPEYYMAGDTTTPASKTDLAVSTFFKNKSNKLQDIAFLLVEAKVPGTVNDADWKKCETQVHDGLLNCLTRIGNSGDGKYFLYGIVAQGLNAALYQGAWSKGNRVISKGLLPNPDTGAMEEQLMLDLKKADHRKTLDYWLRAIKELNTYLVNELMKL